jgi:hypothetical protein
MAKKRIDFWEVFAELPEDHKATISAAMDMYATVMRNKMGSVTFSRKDVEMLNVFDDGAKPLDWSKASDFASMAATMTRC